MIVILIEIKNYINYGRGAVFYTADQHIVINKCFHLNPEKIGTDSWCHFREKRNKRFVKMTSPCLFLANS